MCSQLTHSMEDYLSIPSQRLAVLTQRYQEKAEAVKLVRQVQRSCPDSAHIVRGIMLREERRQEEFSSSMSRLGAMRKELAHDLTDALSRVEKETRTFLIKPVYSKQLLRSPDLITPLPRPLPASQRHSAALTRSRPHTSFSTRPSTSSSNVRQIQSYLQSQRQQVNPQELIDSVNAASKLWY